MSLIESTLPGQESGEYLSTPSNEVEKLVHHEFSNPALWHAERPILYTPIAGLVEDYDSSEILVANPNQTWLANLYGSRVVLKPSVLTTEAVEVESVGFDALTQIHEKLNEGVLKGEGMRIAKVVVPPNKSDIFHPDNVDAWLDDIRHHIWPIMMLQGKTGSHELYANFHDAGDYHLGNFATFPREVQDITTETTVHEQAWRRKFHKGEVPHKFLLLSGEHEHDDDPWGSKLRGGSGLGQTGVNKLDDISGVDSYMPMLAYLVDHPEQDCQQRLEYLQSYNPKQDGYNTDERFLASSGLGIMRAGIGDLVNFNSRHRDGENATPELVEHEYQKFLTGVVRVAKKIRGEMPDEA